VVRNFIGNGGMSTFGKRVDGAGRRRAMREKVLLAGSARTVSSSRSVVVTDVSPTGAKLLGRELPRKSANVLVSVGNVDLFATVAWSGGDSCGIAFESPLTPQLTEHLKREGRWAKVMGVSTAA
jgi:hypothetical protein